MSIIKYYLKCVLMVFGLFGVFAIMWFGFWWMIEFAETASLTQMFFGLLIEVLVSAGIITFMDNKDSVIRKVTNQEDEVK